MVAVNLKRLVALDPRGRTIRDLVRNYVDHYNLAPLQQAVTVHQAEDGLWEAVERRWGLVPAWAKDEAGAAKLINARAETMAEKPNFRSSFKSSRLLVPVSGFYEWAAIAGRKRPYFIHPAGGGLWWFASLGAVKGDLKTFTVITTAANAAMEELHARMPAILGPEEAVAWLDPGTPPGDLQALLRPCPDAWIQAHEVGPAVGNIKNDGPELILPLRP